MSFLPESTFLNQYIFPAPKPSYDKESFRDLIMWFAADEEDPNSEMLPGLLLQNADGATHILVYCHGNAVDNGIIVEELLTYSRYLRVHIFAVEYPGYGPCPGKPTEASIFRAMTAALNFLKKKLYVPMTKVILMGRSIGTGPATKAAADRCDDGDPVAALVLQSPFTSVKECAMSLFGGIAMIISDRFRNKDYITKCSCPLMIVHGKRDQIIPCSQSLELIKRCPSKKKLLVTPELADHDQFDFQNDILDPTLEFFRKYVDNYDERLADLCLPQHAIENAKYSSQQFRIPVIYAGDTQFYCL